MLRSSIVAVLAGVLVLSAASTASAGRRQVHRPLVFVRAHCTTSACSWAIVAATANDRDERRLAGPYPTDAFDERLVVNWAPDARSVIFMANQAIWRVNVSGPRHLRKVFQAPSGTGLDDSPSFTPDGRHIVFTRCCPKGFGYSLWMIRADGTHLRDVTKEPVVNGDGPADTGPQVSPDGTRIAFDRCFPDKPCVLATVDLRGRHRMVLATPQHGAFEPNWSPDSKRLVFGINTQKGPAIALVNADGSGLHRITHAKPHQANFAAAFIAAGRIVFARFPSMGGIDLFTMNQRGSDWHRLTNTRGADEFWPQWFLRRR
jgi:Tol biopolymer transport system component